MCTRVTTLQLTGFSAGSCIHEDHCEFGKPFADVETAVVDQARRCKEFVLKETLHIQLTSAEECFNTDEGEELPECWNASLQMLKGRAGSHHVPSSGHMYP